MRRLLLILILVAALTPTPRVAEAQTTDCDPAALITKLAALKSTGDDAKDVAALIDIRDQITALNVACNGYKFEGKSNKAIGPFELPKGKFLMTLTTDSGIIMDAELLSGNCSIDGDKIGRFSVFAVPRGEASEGAAVVIDSDGCRVILTTEILSKPWTLTIEPLK